MSHLPNGKPGNLHEAIAQGNPAEIARAMKNHDFTLIEDWDEDEEMEEGDRGAMIVEVNDFPALLAFTSEECAGNFVATTPELLGDDGSVPGFVVTGDNLFGYLPDGYGVILNPETEEECEVLPPDLAARIKRFMTPG